MLTYSRAWSYACLSQTPSINEFSLIPLSYPGIPNFLIYYFILLAISESKLCSKNRGPQFRINVETKVCTKAGGLEVCSLRWQHLWGCRSGNFTQSMFNYHNLSVTYSN